MKNSNRKSDSMSALKLALIITGFIVAAAGIVLLIVKLCKKKCHTKKVCDCCFDDEESIDSWDIDEDALGELELDDDCDCCCDSCEKEETAEAEKEESDAE